MLLALLFLHLYDFGHHFIRILEAPLFLSVSYIYTIHDLSSNSGMLSSHRHGQRGVYTLFGGSLVFQDAVEVLTHLRRAMTPRRRIWVAGCLEEELRDEASPRGQLKVGSPAWGRKRVGRRRRANLILRRDLPKATFIWL
jgi:hypothetical protein